MHNSTEVKSPPNLEEINCNANPEKNAICTEF